MKRVPPKLRFEKGRRARITRHIEAMLKEQGRSPKEAREIVDALERVAAPFRLATLLSH